MNPITLTTSIELPGRPDYEILGIITAECVYGMNLFGDIMASVRDIFGGRSEATQKVLRDAREVCLSELRQEAALIGADAVIAVDLDYQEISGRSKSGMILLVASGTAIRLKTPDHA